MIRFGESAERAGAKTLADLAAHVEPLIHTWLGHYGKQYSEAQRVAAVRGLCGPIRQMLRLTAPQTDDSNTGMPDPFAEIVPGFFKFLSRERGLRETTLVQYRHYLRRFEDYLRKVERPLLPNLPPSVLADFITRSGESIDARSVQSLCSILKVFFRYLYRSSRIPRDLSKAIESPRRYRFANLPRSICWIEVERR